MKITIKSPEEKTIRLVFPTRMLFNRFSAKIGIKTINKYISCDNIKVSSHDLRRLAKEINRIKHKYPNLVIVDVESSDGHMVQIKL